MNFHCIFFLWFFCFQKNAWRVVCVLYLWNCCWRQQHFNLQSTPCYINCLTSSWLSSSSSSCGTSILRSFSPVTRKCCKENIVKNAHAKDRRRIGCQQADDVSAAAEQANLARQHQNDFQLTTLLDHLGCDTPAAAAAAVTIKDYFYKYAYRCDRVWPMSMMEEDCDMERVAHLPCQRSVRQRQRKRQWQAGTDKSTLQEPQNALQHFVSHFSNYFYIFSSCCCVFFFLRFLKSYWTWHRLCILKIKKKICVCTDARGTCINLLQKKQEANERKNKRKCRLQMHTQIQTRTQIQIHTHRYSYTGRYSCICIYRLNRVYKFR